VPSARWSRASVARQNRDAVCDEICEVIAVLIGLLS
jgi:hypothetical protein